MDTDRYINLGSFFCNFLFSDITISYFIGFVRALFGSLHRAGRRMHFRSMSLGIRAKLALRYIPTGSVSRVFDAGCSCNPAVAIHNGNITVHVILGCHGGRHFRHHYPSRQAIR